MKYVVSINGESRDVALDAEGVRYEGELLDVELGDPEGSPIRVLRIGNEVHRAVVIAEDGLGLGADDCDFALGHDYAAAFTAIR